MLSTSLLAEEVRRPCPFYKHYVPTARLSRFARSITFLRQAPLQTKSHFLRTTIPVKLCGKSCELRIEKRVRAVPKSPVVISTVALAR